MGGLVSYCGTRGRPRGARNLATDLSAELGKTVTIREDGRWRRISKQQALIKSITHPDARESIIEDKPTKFLDQSSALYFHSHADLSSIIFNEMNARLLESFLYFDDRRELAFLNTFVSFNALQGCQA